MNRSLEFNENELNNGRYKIEWARSQMPVLSYLRDRFLSEKPFKNIVIGGSLHITKETAVLIKTLVDLGAKVAWCASNPLSTQDDVVQALKAEKIEMYAWSKMKSHEYYTAMDSVLNFNPEIIVDDGGDFLVYLYTKKKEYLSKIIGATEQTSSGVNRLRVMENQSMLKHPVIAVNDSVTKKKFDNVYGTGQSTFDGILRAISIMIAGKKVVVVGYGFCGQGIAMRARGFGAHVIVTEVNHLFALQAVMDGFDVMPLDSAAALGDIFITATGMKNVIRKEHFIKMKDQAILANVGHYDSEISIQDLESLALKKEKKTNCMMSYQIETDKILYLLAEGRLVNLICGEGHPPEIMDLSFANQLLALIRLISDKSLENKIYVLPEEIDEKVSQIKLNAMGIKIDELNEEQKVYQQSYQIKDSSF